MHELGHCGATIIPGAFGAGSGFHVGYGGSAGRWAIILWGLDTFLMFPNFLSLKSFGNSLSTSYILCL